MLQIKADNFTLFYDFAADEGELRYGYNNRILAARVERGVWIPQNAAAWFEFEYSNDRYTKGHRPRTPKLESDLIRLRALAGLSDDCITRSVALWELRQWDKMMRHGIWKCRDPYCELRCIFLSLRSSDLALSIAEMVK